MDMRHFKMIQEVARQGNLTRAAEQLFLSQSALSHQLRDVESYFDARIFIRQQRKMILTVEGQIILRASETVLAEIENTRRKVRAMTQKDAGVVRLSVSCFTSCHWLSSFIGEFNKQFPGVGIEINAAATNRAEEALLENVIDVAITENNLHNKFNYTHLFRDELMVIVPKNHPWNRKQWVMAEDFVQEHYIMYDVPPERCAVYQTFFNECEPKKATRVALTEAMVHMVKAGVGVAILPQWIVAPYLEWGGLQTVRMTSKGIKRSWYAATLKHKEMPIYMHAFIRNLSRHLRKAEGLAMLETA